MTDIPEKKQEEAKPEGIKQEEAKKEEKKKEEEPMEVDEYEIKKVNKKRHNNIKYTYEMHGLGKKVIQDYLETEQRYSYADSMILTTKHSKNNYESYIYETRNKLQSIFAPYVEADTAKKLLDILKTAEEWLYNEGKSANKEGYDHKLEDLKKQGDPIYNRCN